MMKKYWLSREKINGIALALILLVCYTYFFPRWADNNQNSRLDMVVAVVNDGSFVIDKYVGNTVDYAHFGDHYYSDKPPGAAFLGIPLYAGLRAFLDTPVVNGLVTRLGNNSAFQATLNASGSGIYADKVRFAITQVVLTFFVSILASVLLCVFLYQLLLGFKIRPMISAGVVLLYGLLTPAFAYSDAFYSHQLSAALLVGAFLLARTEKPFSVPRLLAIGGLLAYAVISEYPTALIAGILFVYVLYLLYRRGEWKKIGWVALVAAVGAVGLMVYNQAIFGSPISLGYDYSERWSVQHHTGFMSLTMPHWDAIWGITFGVFRGLFVLSPILLLALPGFVLWWRSKRNRAEFWVSLASILAMFLFNSSSVMWWGGFSIGPRYLLPGVPFMALSIGFAIEQWGSKGWFKALTVLLSLWSLVATWGLTLAGQSYPSDTIGNPFLDYALPNWLSGNIARNFGTLLGLRGIGGLLPLMGILLVIGIVWWLAHSSDGAMQRKLSNLEINDEVSYSHGK